MENKPLKDEKPKNLTKENIKAIINGALFGLVLVFICIFGFILFILDIEFLFDVFDIGKKKK